VETHNFDHPNAFDWTLFRESLEALCSRPSVTVPRYSFAIHNRLPDRDTITAADIVIVEGILTLYDAEIRNMMDLKVYVDTEDDVRLARRIQRDITERGRTVQDILHQYLYTVKPAHDEFIQPSKRYADIIVPRGGDNLVAIGLIAEHIKRQLEKRGYRMPVSPYQRATTLNNVHVLGTDFANYNDFILTRAQNAHNTPLASVVDETALASSALS